MSDRKENINFNLYEDIKKRTNGEILKWSTVYSSV